MTGWLSSRTWPIGLDFGASCIRLLRLAPAPEGARVIAAARWDLPPGAPPEGPQRQELLTEGCGHLLAECGLRGRRGVEVAASLPDHAMRYKSVRMPHMPPDELAGAIEWEAADHFSSEHDPLSVRHLLAGDVQQADAVRHEVILMAAAQSEIDTIMRVLDGCGLEVAALEAAPTALARCFGRAARRVGDRRDVRAFLDIGAGGAKILILRGDRPAFYRRIEPDSPHQDQAPGPDQPAPTTPPSRRLALSPERLAREVALCLRYYSVTFRGERPDTVYLCGGGANDPSLPQVLNDSSSAGACPAEPLSDAECQGLRARHDSPPHEWAVAVGLALRGSRTAHGVKRGAA